MPPKNTLVARTLQPNRVRTMPAAAALAEEISYTTAVDTLCGALQRVYGDAKSGAKLLARAANRNERTAANLLAKRNLPDALTMLRLMATVPEFAAEVRRITGQLSTMDPEFERDLSKLLTQYQRMRGNP